MTDLLSRIEPAPDATTESHDTYEERRLARLTRTRESYARHWRDTTRRDKYAAIIRARSTPLHLVTLHTDTDSEWTCYASDGAIAEWRASDWDETLLAREEDRQPRLLAPQVVQRARGRTATGSVRQDGRTDGPISLDSLPSADRFLESEATEALRGNQTGLGRWQTAFRLARLDSAEPLPRSADRGHHYLTEEPWSPEAIAYRCLWDGSAAWLRRAPPQYTEIVAHYIDLWRCDESGDGHRPKRQRQGAHKMCAPGASRPRKDSAASPDDHRTAMARFIAEQRGVILHGQVVEPERLHAADR